MQGVAVALTKLEAKSKPLFTVYVRADRLVAQNIEEREAFRDGTCAVLQGAARADAKHRTLLMLSVKG